MTPLAGVTVPFAVANVTVFPATPLPPMSVTIAITGDGNAVLIGPVCPPPLASTRFAAGPTTTSNGKLAAVMRPVADAASV